MFTHSFHSIAEFREFIRAQQYDLESGSVLLSRTVHPQADAEACASTLDAMAARCRELIVEPGTAREKCRVINRVLFHESGFRGNVEDYTDPNNSFLDQVLTRRRGIPVSLSIVYLLVARRLGLLLSDVNARTSSVAAATRVVEHLGGALDRTMAALEPYLLQLQIEQGAADA